MALRSTACTSVKSGALARLASDTRGNALAIMAMALFPLAGLVGGGVDMSRLYLSKTRLQQACDAGALAGRKVMGGGIWTANSNAAGTTALEFFNQNFREGSYGTNTRTVAFTEAAGKVTGTASVVLPMTIMKIFGADAKTLSVTCDAEMRLPHTDVMFVLDLSGTMNGVIPGDTQVKIVALKNAVKCFYESVARLNTTATCGTGDPSGGVGTQTQVRFGFVNYSTNVNVGKLLPAEYFADSWPYQTRKAVPKNEEYQVETSRSTSWNNGTPTVTSDVTSATVGTWGPYTNSVTNGIRNGDCTVPASAALTNDGAVSEDKNKVTTTSGMTRVTTWYTEQKLKAEHEYRRSWVRTSGNGGNALGTCTRERRVATAVRTRNYRQQDSGTETIVYETRTREVFDKWDYQRHFLDIRGLKNGSGWNASLTLPIGPTNANALTVTNRTIPWDGCIEERETEKLTDYSSMTDAQFEKASDLDIDELPVSTDPSTLWGPALPHAIYVRQLIPGGGARNRDQISTQTDFTSADPPPLGQAPNPAAPSWCTRESRKLAAWNDATAFENYVDSLVADGRTHHDIGLLWGARFLSPTGIFANENKLTTTPAGGQISRHMVYMTDGETCVNPTDYTAYGAVWFERRQTSTSVNPTGNAGTCSGENGDLTVQVDKRFEYLCSAAKLKNITLWVIYFGVTPAVGQPDTPIVTRMKNCATDTTKFKPANNAAQLRTAFDSIASQISQLRLTL